jgi:hypothetical protein
MFKQVHGKETVLRARVFQRCEWFSEGRDEDELYSQPVHTSSSKQDENVENVRSLRDERCLAVRIIAEEPNAGLQRFILTENSEMRIVCANMVPKNLSYDQLLRKRKFEFISVTILG